MNLPNKLTLLRCLMTPLMLLAMLWDFPFHYGVSLVLFIAASLTDMLDGKIARKRGLITNLGKFLDPLADKMLTTAAFLGFMTVLGGSSLCWAVMLILTRELMVTSVRLLAAKDGVVVAASMAGKVKTVMQMASIIYLLTAMQAMELFPQLLPASAVNASWFGDMAMWLAILGHVLIWISVVATVISGIQYVWALRHYFKEN